jgi:hypothetical protein
MPQPLQSSMELSSMDLSMAHSSRPLWVEAQGALAWARVPLQRLQLEPIESEARIACSGAMSMNKRFRRSSDGISRPAAKGAIANARSRTFA